MQRTETPIKKLTEALSNSMRPAESQQESTVSMKDRAGSSKFTRSSFYQEIVAYKICKSAWESSRCRRPGDEFFLNAPRVWYRQLKDFPIRFEDERHLLPWWFEKMPLRCLTMLPVLFTAPLLTSYGIFWKRGFAARQNFMHCKISS